MKQLYKAVGYLVFIAIFILTVIWGEEIQHFYKLQAGRNAKPYPSLFVMSIRPIITGALIASPLLLKNMLKEGKWQVNWIRLVIVGLPTLLLGTLPAYYYTQFSSALGLPFSFVAGLLKPSIIMLNGVMFGFTLINSFEKSENGEEIS